MGVIGGLLGALFVIVNNKVNFYRKKILTQKWIKVLEAVLLVGITVTTFFMCSYFSDQCTDETPDDFMVKKDIEIKRFNCPEG